jgi:hypothetical protein
LDFIEAFCLTEEEPMTREKWSVVIQGGREASQSPDSISNLSMGSGPAD